MALQAAVNAPQTLWPLDVPGAETEGIMGYLIEKELMNALPARAESAMLLTRVEVERIRYQAATDQHDADIAAVLVGEAIDIVTP